MRNTLFFFALCVWLGIFGLYAKPAVAQSASAGTVSGQVTDPQEEWYREAEVTPGRGCH